MGGISCERMVLSLGQKPLCRTVIHQQQQQQQGYHDTRVRLSRLSLQTFSKRTMASGSQSVEEEDREFENRVKEIEQWFASPRFKNTTRPYDAATVAAKRGSLPIQYPSNVQAKKLWATLKRFADEKKPLLTMGAIDPVQMTQMAPNQEVLYVSGWATSSVLASSNMTSSS